MADALRGKAALVTGASRRLGRAIAIALAGEGMDLVLHYRKSRAEAESLAVEVEAAGVKAALVPADLASAAAARAMVAAAARIHGRLDLLVNNASAFHPTPLATVSEAEWDELHAINLKAPFFCSLEAATALADGGSIVNIADASVETPWPGYVAYQVSKAGLVALTGYLAVALAPRLRVNAVAPGPILMPAGATAAEAERAIRRVPLGRAGEPQDVANAVVYLASSPYLTGVVLPVDGGRRLG
jgi:pteridine reductase